MRSPPGLVTLISDEIRLGVAPGAGARVVSLIDRSTGRNWLAEGEATRSSADGAYGLTEAAGWDECFPTVSPCDVSQPPWRRRRLRDHGELWGRSWQVIAQTPGAIGTAYSSDGLHFIRSLALRGPSIEAVYRVENTLEVAAPFLWAMHPLFVLKPGESIFLHQARSLSPTYVSLNGQRLEATTIPWPQGDPRVPFSLDSVQGPEARFAGKFFFNGAGLRQASLGGPERWIDIGWDGVDHVGLWLTYGAWPRFNDVVHVAIEPTTSPDDTLAGAISNGRARLLAPGGSQTWRVQLTLRDGGGAT